MDSFIKIVEQKKSPVVTTIHTKQIELIQRYISERKNVFICGPIGVGKTFILNTVLEGTNNIELLPHHLKRESHFLPFIKPSKKHVYIDNYDTTFKSIIEQVSDGDRLTRGSLIVTTTTMCMFPNFETIMIPRHTPNVLMTLVDDRGNDTYMAAVRSEGNIRNFFTYMEGYTDIDSFKTPKEFINDILSDPNPVEICDSIPEHGHIWDIFQENYIDSEGVDLLKCSYSFSMADLFDNCIYQSGNWYLMPYFVLYALTIPKSALGKPLDKNKIRPGSCWTKLGNYKMRKQKFSEIRKKSRMGLGIEELCLLKKYAESGDLEPLLEYKITPQDFDVINHLAVGNGLKSKDVTRVKKALKNAYDRR
jgi:AAA+ ATPase superfamily predicted ATPase